MTRIHTSFKTTYILGDISRNAISKDRTMHKRFRGHTATFAIGWWCSKPHVSGYVWRPDHCWDGCAWAARESECQLESNSLFQPIIRVSASYHHLTKSCAEVYALFILRRMGVLKLRQSYPSPKSFLAHGPCKKHTSTDNIVRGVAPMINLWRGLYRRSKQMLKCLDSSWSCFLGGCFWIDVLAGLTSHPMSFNLFLNAPHVTLSFNQSIKDWLIVHYLLARWILSCNLSFILHFYLMALVLSFHVLVAVNTLWKHCIISLGFMILTAEHQSILFNDEALK